MLRRYPYFKYYRFPLIAVVLASPLMMSSANAFGPPIQFDNFSASAGVISAVCPTDIACSDRVASNGMLQRRIDVPVGENAGSYVQFIMTEPGVTGAASANPFTTERGNLNFTNEDFVKMYNRGDGISSKQTYISSSFEMPGHNPDIEDRFVSNNTYNFGWALSNDNPWVSMSQEISQVDYRADPLNPLKTFTVTADIISTGPEFNTNYDILLTQMVNLVGLGGVESDGVEKFAYKRVSGVYQDTSRIQDGTLLPDGSNGGDIYWSSGQSLSALWVGQTFQDLAFGHTRYMNLDTTIKEAGRLNEGLPNETHLTSDTNPNAVNWLNQPFGPVADILVNDYLVAPTDRIAILPPVDPLAITVPPGTMATDTTTAGAPTSFDQWTVTDGIIAAGGCTLDILCDDPTVLERGMLQRKIKVLLPSLPEDPQYEEYYQTIITDLGATGDPTIAKFDPGSLGFMYESFNRAGVNNVNGIASQMKIYEQDLAYMNYAPDSNNSLHLFTSNSGEFSLYNTIQTGWAQGGPLDPRVVVNQHITVPDQGYLHVSSMDNIFHMEVGDREVDKKIYMLYVVGSNNFTGSGFLDNIMFATSIVQGAYQDNERLATASPLLPSINGNIAWAPGDALQATWVGASYVTSDPSGATIHRTTSYTNLSEGTRTVAVDTTIDLENTDPNPESWVEPFLMPAPFVSSVPAYSIFYTPPLLP